MYLDYPSAILYELKAGLGVYRKKTEDRLYISVYSTGTVVSECTFRGPPTFNSMARTPPTDLAMCLRGLRRAQRAPFTN